MILLAGAVTGALALTACSSDNHSTPSHSAASASAPAPTRSKSAPRPTQAAKPTEHLITNDDHRIAFYVTPGHSPAIVLDSGGGEDHTEWDEIAPKLHAATGDEIITYDRAGIGNSDEVPGPWKVENAVSDLQTGLRQLEVTKDVILAAHSQGGEVATYFVRANPQLVSEAVLIDASLPDFYTDEEITRLVAATEPQVDAAKKNPPSQANRQLIATAESYVPMHKAYHKMTWPNSVPATVIVSAKTPFDGSPQDAQRWRNAAASFAAAASNRTLITATGSSHEVPKGRPDLVLKAIEQMAAEHE